MHIHERMWTHSHLRTWNMISVQLFFFSNRSWLWWWFKEHGNKKSHPTTISVTSSYFGQTSEGSLYWKTSVSSFWRVEECVLRSTEAVLVCHAGLTRRLRPFIMQFLLTSLSNMTVQMVPNCPKHVTSTKCFHYLPLILVSFAHLHLLSSRLHLLKGTAWHFYLNGDGEKVCFFNHLQIHCPEKACEWGFTIPEIRRQ